MHVFANGRGLAKGLVQLLPGRVGFRLEHAPLGDGRQVAVLERDGVEARLPPLEHVGERQLLRAGDVLAHQLAQVALPGDEADEGNRPVGGLGLHELRQLLPFVVHEGEVGGMAGQPEDQLVEEQDDGVVAETPGVLADDRQPIVERDVRLVCPAGDLTVGREEAVHEIADETRTLLGSRGRGNRLLEASCVPRSLRACPSPHLRPPALRLAKERLVAESSSHLPGVVEHPLGEIDARQRRLWVERSDVLGVVAEDGRLHRACADHVIRHEQELASLAPGVMRRHDGRQLGNRAGPRITLQEQVQHRHEVALAAAEAAVQVGGLARRRLERAWMKPSASSNASTSCGVTT